MHSVREFKIFTQKFTTPLPTANGLWEERQSIILKETYADSTFSFGEVAITPGFNSFSFQDALSEVKLWQKEDDRITYRYICPALSCMKASIWKEDALVTKEVVPACLYFERLRFSGYNQVIKRKIGLKPPKVEIPEILIWMNQLPAGSKVRLDPNQSLTNEHMIAWLYALEGNKKVEFIEQPVPGMPSDAILDIITSSKVPVALDEAIITLGGLRKVKELGWDGYFVVKPSLLDDWADTLCFLQEHPNVCVVSTVFESPIGYECVIRTCIHSNLIPGIDRRLFLGGKYEIDAHHQSSLIVPSVSNQKLDELWRRL